MLLLLLLLLLLLRLPNVVALPAAADIEKAGVPI